MRIIQKIKEKLRNKPNIISIDGIPHIRVGNKYKEITDIHINNGKNWVKLR